MSCRNFYGPRNIVEAMLERPFPADHANPKLSPRQIHRALRIRRTYIRPSRDRVPKSYPSIHNFLLKNDVKYFSVVWIFQFFQVSSISATNSFFHRKSCRIFVTYKFGKDKNSQLKLWTEKFVENLEVQELSWNCRFLNLFSLQLKIQANRRKLCIHCSEEFLTYLSFAFRVFVMNLK